MIDSHGDFGFLSTLFAIPAYPLKERMYEYVD